MDNYIWYHGSPQVLSFIAKGSTITKDKNLAKVFSHKPTIVAMEDDGQIRHNGKAKGYLHIINEELIEEDIYMHPNTTMDEGLEWLTTRDLKVKFIEIIEEDESELLSLDDIEALRCK